MTPDLSDVIRRLHGMASLGSIADADHARGLIRVRVGTRVTGWLPVPGIVGHNFRGHTPVKVGMQVLLLCPGGDPATAVPVQVLYSNADPSPESRPDTDVLLWLDGTRLEYDSAAQRLIIHTPGQVLVDSQGPVTVTSQADVTVTSAATVAVSGADKVAIEAPIITLTGTVQIRGPLSIASGPTGSASARIEGPVQVTGAVDVSGNIAATGSIMDQGGNSPNHKH
ncbi:MAG: hypothetical protein RLY86_127 [Pseudomonadota bacterium]|jgi:phage baseplate assembly protein V